MRSLLVLLSLALSATAQAQVVSYPPAPPVTVDTSSLATKADVAAVQAAIPTPRVTTPMGDAQAGTAGTAGTYMPGNARLPSRSRTGTCVIASGQTCSGTWEGSSFPAGASIKKVGDPAPTNSGSLPVQCNWMTMTVDGYTVKCWVGQTTLVSLLGSTVTPWSTSVVGISVDVVALTSSAS